MSFDVEEMLRSKKALRQRLAALPIAEKLRLLDELRERSMAIRSAGSDKSNVIRKEAHTYKPGEQER